MQKNWELLLQKNCRSAAKWNTKSLACRKTTKKNREKSGARGRKTRMQEASDQCQSACDCRRCTLVPSAHLAAYTYREYTQQRRCYDRAYGYAAGRYGDCGSAAKEKSSVHRATIFPLHFVCWPYRWWYCFFSVSSTHLLGLRTARRFS